MLQLMCLCWHLIAPRPPLLFPCSGCRGRASLKAPCVVLICSEGSEGRRQRCTGRSRCCWSCWHILLGCSSTLYYQASSSVASNQNYVLSGQASFFYKSHHALQVLCTWGKHLKAFGHFCSLTTFMFHPSDIKLWLACWIMTNHPLLDCNHGDEGLILLRVIIHEVLVLLGIQQGRLFNFCAVCRAAAALALLLIISLFLQPTCVETGDVAEKQRYYCEIKE